MTAADAQSTSSGQTRQTTSTTLTVRQSNVMSAIQSPVPSSKSFANKGADPPSKPPLASKSNNNNNGKGKATPSAPPASAAIVDAEKGNNSPIAATTAFYAPDAPLPTARQLSKVMCRIVDNDAYTKSDALVALQRLHQWALKQDINFGNAIVGIGGIQHVLFFVEDHQNDAKTIASALLLLEALTTPLDDYESKALTNMRNKISQSIVDGDGIELLMKAFEYHGLPEQPLSNEESTRAMNGTKSSDQDSLWNTFSSIWNCEHATVVVNENTNPSSSIDSLVMNTCGVLSGTDPTLSRNRSFSSPSKKATDTAILCMKVLAKVVPSAAGASPDKSAAILATLVDAIPRLVALDKTATSFAKQEQEALIASIMSCLVSAVKLSKNTVLKNAKNNSVSKQVIDVTVKMMREFPHHPQIVCDGCLVLQGVCPHLQKSERKRYGVVAALGAVVASDNMMDKKVKEIADAILEEQFK
jgi:hypothetical protein